MTQHPDPLADPLAEPMAEPDATQPISSPTTAVPSLPAFQPQHPYRVEPAVPVPDDARVEPLPVLPATRHGVHVRRGPRPGAVVLGLLSMLVSAYVIAANISGTHLELRVVGPALVGALGGLLLLVGLAGVVVGRLRR